ncbi:LAFA_0E21506g1_1 [Lachancea sp. 'fantastica']|nr:LAFA_0E21506g1_1 [Lachancea sp. 'fantastica']
MTKSEPDSLLQLGEPGGGVQLKHLPNLTEVSSDTLEDPLKKILEKAIAVQLKAINSNVCVSQLAFENLILLVEEALSGMLVDLHKVANIQRRHCISKKDLLLVIEGYNLTCADLMVEYERSRFVRSRCLDNVEKVGKDGKEVLHKERSAATKEELLRSSHPEFFDKGKGILKLVPPSVKEAKHVPKWLPEFPPDHTYRFTSLYNKSITDERQMKRKLAEESNLSEKALINFSRLSNEESHLNVTDTNDLFRKSQEETQLIFKQVKKPRAASVNKVDDLLRTLPQDHYNVEEYARNRVEITRRRVKEHERRQLQIQKGPFMRATQLLSPFAKQRVNCKVAEKDLRALLHRSYIGLLKTAPLVREQRKREIAAAEQRRIEREEQAKREREERNKMSKEFDELDLDNLHEDPFFGGLGSSDSENEPEEPEKDKETLAQNKELPDGGAPRSETSLGAPYGKNHQPDAKPPNLGINIPDAVSGEQIPKDHKNGSDKESEKDDLAVNDNIANSSSGPDVNGKQEGSISSPTQDLREGSKDEDTSDGHKTTTAEGEDT